MAYDVNFPDLEKRAAAYVDKILKVPNLPIFPSSSRPNSRWSSI